jgi:hypothetical protein
MYDHEDDEDYDYDPNRRAKVIYAILDGLEEDAAAAAAEYWEAVESACSNSRHVRK